MRIEDYLIMVDETKAYPGKQVYPILGMIGETGEFLDKMFPVRLGPDGDSGQTKEDLVKELGDILYYVVSVANDFEIPFMDVACRVTGGTITETFAEMENDRIWRNDRRSPYIQIAIQVCSFAERYKKLMRDNKLVDREFLVGALARLLLAMMTICDDNMTTLDEVAQLNADKLLSRKARGVLGGDGDNR